MSRIASGVALATVNIATLCDEAPAGPQGAFVGGGGGRQMSGQNADGKGRQPHLSERRGHSVQEAALK